MIPDRFCGCVGCSEPAHETINHPRYGQRVVCEEHAAITTEIVR